LAQATEVIAHLNLCLFVSVLMEIIVPVKKVKGGYRWGTSGKVYKTKAAAEKQGRAIYASGYKSGKKKAK
jgi:hypothetical protein